MVRRFHFSFNKVAVTRVMTAAVFVLTTAFAAQAAPAQANNTTTICTQTHLVQRGETLSRIARAYGTTVANLQAINGLSNPNRIYTGQSLCVVTQQQPIGGTSYVVQAGDRLSQIARRYGVDMNVLARVNGITNVNRIYVGQTLIIPEVTIQ